MTIQPQENIAEVSESPNSQDTAIVANSNTKKSKLPLILGAIALLIGSTVIARSLSGSQQTTEEVTENIEQARLTVKTVPANLEPIQAWAYGDGTVSAITKKHLTFQAEGTIDY
ncbi:MAG: efflux transporter periplasmic adaptor subunit, partial [Xenococcus sp. (in: cyanobacteria)]